MVEITADPDSPLTKYLVEIEQFATHICSVCDLVRSAVADNSSEPGGTEPMESWIQGEIVDSYGGFAPFRALNNRESRWKISALWRGRLASSHAFYRAARYEERPYTLEQEVGPRIVESWSTFEKFFNCAEYYLEHDQTEEFWQQFDAATINLVIVSADLWQLTKPAIDSNKVARSTLDRGGNGRPGRPGNPERDAEIWRHRQDGMSNRDIGEKFGLSESAVSKACTRHEQSKKHE